MSVIVEFTPVPQVGIIRVGRHGTYWRGHQPSVGSTQSGRPEASVPVIPKRWIIRNRRLWDKSLVAEEAQDSRAPGWTYKDPLNTTKAPVPHFGGNRALYLYSGVLGPHLGIALTGGSRAPIPLQRSNNEPLAGFACDADTGQSLATYFL